MPQSAGSTGLEVEAAAPLLQSKSWTDHAGKCNSTAALHLSSDVEEAPTFFLILVIELVKRPWPRKSLFNGIAHIIWTVFSLLDSNAQLPNPSAANHRDWHLFLHNLQRPASLDLPLLCTPRYRRQAIYCGWDHMEAVAIS
jgi:hypothetical protein